MKQGGIFPLVQESLLACYPSMKVPPCLPIALVAAVSTGCLFADVKLPAIISDHMVLEKSAKVPIWGKADPGEEVTVMLGGQATKAKAGADGKWMASLDLKNSAPGPFEMKVEGKNKLTLADVVVGEVWVASGQSNMEWVLANTTGAAEEIVQSANPMLRQFLVKKNATCDVQDDTEGAWVAASPQTSGAFSAAGYYFAKKLQNELKVPVGLVHTSWGGTPSEAWTSVEAIDSIPGLKASRERDWAVVKEYPGQKSAFVEGMDKWVRENAREDRPVADAAPFAGMDVSTEGWIPVTLPGEVKAPGLPESGAVWLRKEIEITNTAGDFSLQLPIDGYDTIYWNGDLIKQTTYQDFPGTGYVRRHGPYTIKPSALKKGKNILAIRLYEPVGPAKLTAPLMAG
ncbi:MAG: acetyl esterase, partial [Verrucomicrobiaceae bacterium]